MNHLILGDSLDALLDHRGKTPKKLGGDFALSGIPVVSALLVHDGRLDLSDARFISKEMYATWMPQPTKRGDVILTSEAPAGRVARVLNEDPLALGQRVFCLRGKSGVLDSGFLYYALQTNTVQSSILGHSTGTTVVGIRQSALRQVRIPAPPLPEQQAIAEVLGALDDKIAANTAVAATATHLATTEFTAAARSATWGPTFDQLADVSGGGTPSTRNATFWDGEIWWATPTDMTALAGPYLESTARTITASGLAACSSKLFEPGAILMTSRATIGTLAVNSIPTALNQGFIVVEPHDPSMRWWLFHEMESRVNEFVSWANGATFLELSRGNFRKLPVRIPSAEALSAFAEAAEALHGAASGLLTQNRTLAATRDALLPQLMSGKLRVRDAEQLAADAGA